MTVCYECGVEIKPELDDSIDEVRHRVLVGVEWRRLSKHEWLVFSAMRSRVGRVVSRAFLLEYIYEERDEPDQKVIDVYICKLRKKLKGSQFRIETIWGHGWMLHRGA